ncbi:unnamed protein product [Bursaphelenchus okinawaensis]|uniref:RRM domain-containing protein n=1 Tax=Bursaphelenchus okinawaensis TaxID=465554 RepID=A0A811KBM4_9BILA|nr:unnamed protein product [Bursaphelenchus okinawaensis]CAG9097572.1 unnamed protein product [Bursaphelenchus okinawaensis]
MLLASGAGDFEANRENKEYLAQLLAAQQQAAAALGQQCQDQMKENATSASPSSSSDSGSKHDRAIIESKTNLIINYLPQTMSQDEVRSLFASMGPIESCKLVRDKTTGQSLGYAFVNYCNPDDAQRARQSLNGLRLQNKTIKVSLARPSHETIKGANLYVSGLPKTLTQPELEKLFISYGSIITSRILSDNVTGLSKGVGFVRFDRKSEAEVAIEKMNGTTPPGFTEPLQVKFANNPAAATQKNMLQVSDLMTQAALAPIAALQSVAAFNSVQRPSVGPIRHTPQLGTLRYSPLAAPTQTALTAQTSLAGAAGYMPTQTADLLTTQAILQQLTAAQTQQQQLAALNAAALASQQQAQVAAVQAAPKVPSPSGTSTAAGFSIFVYNLGPETDEPTLWRLFGPFGAVLHVNVMKDTFNKCKGYGFVTMANYEDSLNAITNLNGTQLGNRTLQVSFKSAQNAMYR